MTTVKVLQIKCAQNVLCTAAYLLSFDCDWPAEQQLLFVPAKHRLTASIEPFLVDQSRKASGAPRASALSTYKPGATAITAPS